MRVINDTEEHGARVPLFCWAPDPEDGALEQARHLMHLPFAFHHVALMPDTHQGYGMPIGGVLATTGAVIPNAVGVDIGCGMRAWATGIAANDFLEHRDHVMHQITRAVPTGFNWHHEPQDDEGILDVDEANCPIVASQREKALLQLGTLGGGNHFIEAQADGDGELWMMIHSGSRNLGLQVAKYYNRVAVELNASWHSSVPREHELAFLPLGTEEAECYLLEMGVCLSFAKMNRARMEEAIRRELESVFGSSGEGPVDIHHNYVVREHHFGKNVWVHRKGAVLARGVVIIPGSMGSSSYICKGLDNQAAFGSCSHGAGRAMGRKAAKRSFPAEDVLADMESRGVALFKPKVGDVAEECVQAYHDIDAVMEAQQDLVEPLIRLRPLAVIKA